MEIKSSPLQRSYGYFLLFVCLGLDLAVLGPTLPALAAQTGTTVAAMGMIFLVSPIGYGVGTLLGGWLFDWAPGRVILGVAQLVSGGMLFFVPAISWFPLLMVLFVIKGVGGGVINTGANTLMTWMHGDKASPFINALHFFFGLGTFIAPFLVGVFLSAGGVYGDVYRLLALFCAAVGGWILLTLAPPPPVRTRETGGQAEKAGFNLAPIVLSAALFLFFYVGAEITFGGWIYTYAITLGLTDTVRGAYLTSAFWLAFTLGRLASIPIATRVQPKHVIPAAILGGSAFLLLLIAVHDSQPVLWIAAAGIGFCLAPVWPSGFTLAGQSFRLTSRLSGLILLGDSFGGMLLPWLMGTFIERAGPLIMTQLVLGSLLCTMLAYAGMRIFRRAQPNHPVPQA
jgi:MFS transporter, FHS family, Na+ dependent glucose transporter 1